MNGIFYDLYSASDTPLDLDMKDYKRARKTWLCRGCASPRPEVWQVDITVQDGMPPGDALNFVNGCGVSVARKEFLFSLGEQIVQQDLVLGRVFRVDRSEFGDLVTFRGRCRLVMRGQHDVGHRYCEKCGQLVYFSSHIDRYLWPAPPPDFSLFDTGCGGLTISERVFRQLDTAKWKNLWVEELPVLDSPKDGLGVLKGAVTCAA